MRTLPLRWTASLCLAFAGAHAPRAAADFAIFTVGGDAGCQYTDIQAAIDAAAAHPGEDYVWIASNRTYAGQHLTVQDQDVDIEGGFADCSDFDPETAQTPISGAGNGGRPVVSIRGQSHVYLANVFVRDGERGDEDSGGGIAFDGAGRLTVQRATISLNAAGYGGGINFKGNGSAAELHLLDRTLVLNNTATVSGGGVRVEGSARLFAIGDDVLIAYNDAMEYGGGIEILGPARADIASPGYGNLAVVSSNYSDSYGGGIAALGSIAGDARLRVFTIDPQRPTRIDQNTSVNYGGGLFVSAQNGHGAKACVYETSITRNQSFTGAAISAGDRSESGTVFQFNATSSDDPDCGDEPVVALGAVRCAAGSACNSIADNQPRWSDGARADGSVMLVRGNTTFRANRFSLSGSVGSWMLYASPQNAITLANCLIADNAMSKPMLFAEDGNAFAIEGCTLAHNVIDAGVVIDAYAPLTIRNAIIDQPGMKAANFHSPSGLSVTYTLASDAAWLGSDPTVMQGRARFVDVAARDYHLQPGSPGIDFAPAAAEFDLDGHTRVVDLPSVGNRYGPLDLGAFERMQTCGAADTIFCDDLER